MPPTKPAATAADPGSESVGVEACCPPLMSVLDETRAEALASVLKALADPVRLRLLNLIGTAPTSADRWACACDLATPVDRSQPTVSHHLTVLVKAGLLEREQRGKWAWFRVRTDRLADVRAALVLDVP